MPRPVLLLTLLITAADAFGAGRFAVCRMEMAPTPEAPGCGHCPPPPAATVRDGLPDCCAVHAAARPVAAPSEAATRPTRQGPSIAVLPVAVLAPVGSPATVPARRLVARATAPPLGRNLPLLR